MKKFKEDGKTRFLGISIHAGKPELLDAAVEAGIYDVVLLSYNFKLSNLKETEEAIARAAKAGVGLVAMKTMTGGTEDAGGKKKINAQACLKWAWKNEHITTAIPGFSNYDELDECLVAARSPELTAGDQEYLATLADRKCCIASNAENAGRNVLNIFLFLILCGPTCMLTVINIRECRRKHLEN